MKNWFGVACIALAVLGRVYGQGFSSVGWELSLSLIGVGCFVWTRCRINPPHRAAIALCVVFAGQVICEPTHRFVEQKTGSDGGKYYGGEWVQQDQVEQITHSYSPGAK